MLSSMKINENKARLERLEIPERKIKLEKPHKQLKKELSYNNMDELNDAIGLLNFNRANEFVASETPKTLPKKESFWDKLFKNFIVEFP